jgi:glycosyltransferase involved in cell wall biosynthesis
LRFLDRQRRAARTNGGGQRETTSSQIVRGRRMPIRIHKMPPPGGGMIGRMASGELAGPAAANGRARLVVFGDDWGRHPSSAQHLVRHLLDRYAVDWVNVAGTHRPRLSRHDFRRGIEKLGEWAARGRPLRPDGAPANSPAPAVHAPAHWPGFASKLERRVNRFLLARALAPLLARPPAPAAVITTHPLVADLAARFPELNWVYYCVDDLSAWPGLDGAAIAAMERQMLPLMRTVIAASAVLGERLARLGCRPRLLTHGVDLEHWSAVPRRTAAGRPPVAPPVALYWGHIDARLDAEICLGIAAVCELRLVGRADPIDPRLHEQPRVRWLGAVPYQDLPRLAAAADVLVMPYADLPVTRAMQPLKLKEYLATGLPVVATELPATRSWADALDVTSRSGEFARLCQLRARQPLPAAQREARQRLARESWSSKAAEFADLLSAASGAPRMSA